VTLSDDMAKAKRPGEYCSSMFMENNSVLPQSPRTADDKIELNLADFWPDLVYKHLSKLKAIYGSNAISSDSRTLLTHYHYLLSLLFSELFDL